MQRWLRGFLKGVIVEDIDILANNDTFIDYFDEKFNFKNGILDLNNQVELKAKQIEALMKVGRAHDLT